MIDVCAGLGLSGLGRIEGSPGVWVDPDEAAIVRYAQKSTRMDPIDDATYAALREHFDEAQIIEICFTVGLSNMINRFHATFLTELDASTQQALAPSCPLPFPVLVTDGA